MINKNRTENYQDTMNRIFPGINIIRTVTFQVTEDCNLNCTYCYQSHKTTNKMPLDVAKKFIDLLLSDDINKNSYVTTKNSGGIILDFIGGEPLLEIELMDQIIDYWIEQTIINQHPWANRWRASICSNGVLYFDEKFQKFLAKHRNHVSFNISIDGNKKLHDSCRIFPDGKGSYDIAMAGVKHYKNMGLIMGSKMTLAPENIEYTAEAVIGLIESGYDDINLNCVFENVWKPEHATILYNQLKKLADYIIENKLMESHYVAMFNSNFFTPSDIIHNDSNWCGGTGAMIAVDWKGNIYPCLRYMPSSLGEHQPPIVIGNVERGIVTTPEEKECVNCMKCITRSSQSTEECIKCPIATGCAWCSAYNYQEFGTIDKRATYICEMHKARALANVYFWNKAYLLLEPESRFINHVPDEWALKIITENELNMLKELCKR